VIRLLFILFVTLGGFAAAALWTARGGDARDVAAEVVPESLRAALQSAESLSQVVQAEVERLSLEAAASVPDSAAGDSLAVVAANTPAAEVAEREPVREASIDDGPPSEVRDLVPAREFASDTGSDREIRDVAGWEGEEELAEAPRAGAASNSVPPDPEESAHLIRRMLAVYHQTGQLK